MAQSLTFQTGPAAPDLQCPDSKPTSRPPSNPTPLEEIYEIPNDGLLAELMKSLPAQSESVTSSLNLFSNLPKSRPLNIGLWGDSHAAANFFTEELIRAINLPKEKVLPLFIPPTLARGGVRLPLRKQCQGQGWKYELAYTGGQDRLKFSRGMARLITTTNNSYQWIDFRSKANSPTCLGSISCMPPARFQRH
jgi:hypothetical protein